MTKEEAKAEINKVFEPAFANYIITALTDGATPSERKNGKWVRLESGSDGCNQCWTNDFGWARFNYCPNCGAKMEGAN